MQIFRNAPRALLLTVCLLSACAAADPTAGGDRAPAPTSVYGNYLAGRFALGQGDYDAAAADLLQALTLDPDDPELLRQTFIACLNAGRPEALRIAQRLPANQIGQMLMANDAAKKGDWAGALALTRSVPRDGMMQLLQPLLLAWVSQGAGDTDQALVVLRPYLDNQNFRPIVALHAGMIADLAGRSRDAAMFYQDVKAGPGELGPRGALILASWAWRSGDQAGAGRMISQFAASSPEAAIIAPAMRASLGKRPVPRALDGMAEAYLTFSGALRSQQSSELPMVLSRLALDVRPDFATARLTAAEIQINEHHFDAALGLLTEAGKTDDPIVPIVRLRRADLLRQMDRTDEAIREMERIGRDYPDSTLPDIELGDLLRIQRRYTEAAEAYNRVITRIQQPTQADWTLYYSRGICYERTGQWLRAEADFSRALQLSPDQPAVLNYLGYAWADQGRNLGQAYTMIRKAAERRPNDGAITDSLGWVLYRQGKVQEATLTLEKAVSLEPEDPTITDHLGDAYWASGRKIEAVYQWQRALTLNPAPEDAAKLEAKIKSHPFGALASGK